MAINLNKYYKLKKRLLVALLVFLFGAGTLFFGIALGMILYPNPGSYSLPSWAIIIYVVLGMLMLASGFFILICWPVIFFSWISLRKNPLAITAAKKSPAVKVKFYTVFGYIVLSIIFIGFASYFQQAAIGKAKQAIAQIQNNLVEVVSAKTIGDSIIAGKKITGASLENIKSAAKTASQKIAGLAAPDSLKNYQTVALIWTAEISLAAQNTEIWKDIANQPGDFPLTLNEDEAQAFFQTAVQAIADLKKSGAEAIKNNDHEAMRQIAAKLLVQNHWLNGILHSAPPKVAWLNIVEPAYAATANPAQVPAVGPGMDVTCLVCADPKIHWTPKLRQQYGCEIRCKPYPVENPAQNSGKQTQANQAPDKQSELTSFTYKDQPKRVICIGTGGVSTGNATSNKFCVEDAVQSTNEIAAAAIGFADGAKALSVADWDNEYKDVDETLLADGTVGEPVSYPAIADGHLEGGMGTISTGEPDAPPQPVKSPAKKVSPAQPKKLTTPPTSEPAVSPAQEPPTYQPTVEELKALENLKALGEALEKINTEPVKYEEPAVDENTLHNLGADSQDMPDCVRWGPVKGQTCIWNGQEYH